MSSPSVTGVNVRRGRAASLPQWLVLDRFDRYRRHVFDQSDLFLNKRLPIFHAGHHAEIACHGGYAIPDLGVSREVAAARLLIRELRFVGVDGFEARLKLCGNVHHERRADVVVKRGVNDLEGAMRRLRARGLLARVTLRMQFEFAQPGKKASFVAECGAGVVVGMAAFPIGKNHHPRTLFADHAGDFQAILPGVFHAAIGNVQGLPESNLEDPGGVGGFTRAVFGGAARPHFALREVEDPGAQSALRHLEQSAAAGLLHVIAMSGNGQDIQSGSAHSSSPVSTVTFSLTISRCAAISLMCGSTRSTCSSMSMKVTTSGNLPPASTSVEGLTRPCPVKPATACNTVAPATSCSRRYLSISRCRGR